MTSSMLTSKKFNPKRRHEIRKPVDAGVGRQASIGDMKEQVDGVFGFAENPMCGYKGLRLWQRKEIIMRY